MDNVKEFGVGYHTVQHDYGSLNNSPDTFTMVLFSNDLKAVRTEPDTASVRARWRTTFIAPINLEGHWEARLRRLIVRNLQSHVFRVEVHRTFNVNNQSSLIRVIELPRQFYHSALDVLEALVVTLRGEVISKGVDNVVFTKAQLSQEKLFSHIWHATSNHTYLYPLFEDGNYQVPMVLGSTVDDLFLLEEIKVNDVFQKMISKLRVNAVVIKDRLKMNNGVANDIKAGTRAVPDYFFRETDGYFNTTIAVPSGMHLQVGSLSTHTSWEADKATPFDIYMSSNANGRWESFASYYTLTISRPLANFLQLNQLQLLPNSPFRLLDFPDNYVAIYFHQLSTPINIDNSSTIFITEGKNIVSGYRWENSDLIASVSNPSNTHDVVVTIDSSHRLRVITEDDVEVISGSQFSVKEDEMNRWMSTAKRLNNIKMDEVDVFIPELAVDQDDMEASEKLEGLGRVSPTTNKLGDAVPIDREKEMVVYNGNRRSYKVMKSGKGISSLTVELRSTHDKTRSPWFHTGYTMCELQFFRNWSRLTEERL